MIPTLDRPEDGLASTDPIDIAGLDSRFSELKRQRFDLVSFDLFDTLWIRRRDRPEDVFLEVGRRAMERGLLDPGMTPGLFRSLRIRAAQTAEAVSGPERMTLGGIYRCLPRSLLDPDAVMAVEMETEADEISVNPLLARLLPQLRHTGMTVVALSDTYLCHDQLVDLMERTGIDPRHFDRVYASCDAGAVKRDGGLFRRLLADHPAIPPGRMCHIGDDAIADAVMPSRLGLSTVTYGLPQRFTEIIGRERVVAQGRSDAWCDPVRRLAARLDQDDQGAAAFWHGFGALVLGPVLVRYCIWVVEECHRLGIDRIAVMMREGRLMAQIMTPYARSRGYTMTIVPLFVSRLAMGRTEPLRWDRASVLDLVERRPYLRLGDILSQGGEATPPPELAALANRHVEEMANRCLSDGMPVLDAIIAWFGTPDVARSVKAAARAASDLTVRYLRQTFGEAADVALVDLGSRATTAAAIHRLDPVRKRHRLRAFLLYATDPVSAAMAAGLPVSVYAGADAEALEAGRILYRSPHAIERLLTGLDDCTAGYTERDDGIVEPLTIPTAATGEERDAILIAEKGVLRYWTCLFQITPPHCVPQAANGASSVGADGLLPWLAMLQLPTPEEAERLGGLSYDYNDGSAWTRRICDDTALAAVKSLLPEHEGLLMARLLGARPQRVPWPQGAATMLDSEVIRRHHDALATDPGHRGFCAAMVERMRSAGVTRTVLCAAGGAGGMGGAFIEVARAASIEVVAYLDHMPYLVGTLFHGVPVISLEELADRQADAIAVVTLGYRDAMMSDIGRACGNAFPTYTL